MEVILVLILCFANIRMHWAEEENGLVDTLKDYPLSFGLIVYGMVFGAFVTVLFMFHTVLISEFKTTQEKLKKDKGLAKGQYRASPHSYTSLVTNCCRTLCSRRNTFDSLITWELYLYSKGDHEQLEEYWGGRKGKEQRQTRIDKLE